MIRTEPYVCLLIVFGAIEVVLGSLVILRRRLVEAWVRRRYTRLERRNRDDDDEQPIEPRWVPGGRTVVGYGVAFIVLGILTIGVGLVAGQQG